MKIVAAMFLALYVLLPDVATANTDYVSVHCSLGCPENPQGSTLLHRHLYTLSNNPNTKFANWVAYRVSPMNYGESVGRNWKADPLLPPESTLEPEDYAGAYDSVLSVDRGHLAPVAAFAGSPHRYELDYLSNVVPQHRSLNRGAWGSLEEAIRGLATYDEPLSVIAGPLHIEELGNLPKADESHSVPSAFFKIVSNSEGATAFLMMQSIPTGTSFCRRRVALKDLQAMVGFKLPVLVENNELTLLLGCDIH